MTLSTYMPFTGDQHYNAADQLLRDAGKEPPGSERERNLLLRAQVHATLANAAVHMDVVHTIEEYDSDGKRVFMSETRNGSGYGQ
jgi:hypothetical protein